jgi:sigma-54 specific flagellar transcriptional regulator A
MSIVPPPSGLDKPASAARGLLEELLEAGEVDLADGADLAGAAELADTEEFFETAELADRAALAATADTGGFELPQGGMDLKDHLSAIEIGLIRKALAEADGTVAGAARLLRMRRTTLVEKLRKYRLSA